MIILIMWKIYFFLIATFQKNPKQISTNCWRHVSNCCEHIYYTINSDSKSEYHRTDGPAVEFASGYKAWWINGKRHRIDGPAIEWSNGDKEWYYNDQFINVKSQEEFEIYIKNLIFI